MRSSDKLPVARVALLRTLGAMRRLLLQAILAVVLAGPFPASGRTFTSADGRPFEASLVKADARSAILKREADGQPITVPLEKLSQADRDYVAEWLRENPDLNFALSAKKRLIKRQIDNRGQTRGSQEEWQWEITVTNRTSASVAGLIVQYSTYVFVDDKTGGSGGLVRHRSGTVAVPRIPPFGSTEIVTTRIPVESKDRRTVTRTAVGERVESERWNESIRGLNVELYWRDRLATTWSTGGSEARGLQIEPAERPKQRRAVFDWVPIVPASIIQTAIWRSTEVDPGKGWQTPTYPDSGWTEAPAPFGSNTLTNVASRTMRTHWEGNRLWLRRRFTLPAGTRLDALHFRAWVDDEAEIYIDGVKAAHFPGSAAGGVIPVSEEIRQLLAKPGHHLLAVVATNVEGPRFIDVAIDEKQPERP